MFNTTNAIEDSKLGDIDLPLKGVLVQSVTINHKAPEHIGGCMYRHRETRRVELIVSDMGVDTDAQLKELLGIKGNSAYKVTIEHI